MGNQSNYINSKEQSNGAFKNIKPEWAINHISFIQKVREYRAFFPFGARDLAIFSYLCAENDKYLDVYVGGELVRLPVSEQPMVLEQLNYMGIQYSFEE